MKRTTMLFAALAVMAAAAFAIPSLATTASAADTSQVYVVHGIPGVPVDVYVNGTLTLPGFQPEAVAGPLELPAGNYRVEIFAATPAPPEEAPASGWVIDETKTVPAGASVSLIASLDDVGHPALNAFVNDTSTVADGMARVTVRHTAAAAAVDVYVDGVKAISNLTNPNEAIAEIPVGSHEIAVKLAGTDTTVIGPKTLDFAANTNTIAYAIGGFENLNFDLVAQVLDTEIAVPTTQAPATTVAPTPTSAPTPVPAPAKPATPMAAQPAYTG